MKKAALILLIAIVILLTSACESVTYTYELTPVTVTDPYAPMYNGVGEFDTVSMLSDGNIVFREWAMTGGGHTWYRNYIVHPDGYEVRVSDTYYLRTVIETYDGNIFVTDKNGKDVLGCEFDLLSDIVNDRAVAVTDGKAYILEITRQ